MGLIYIPPLLCPTAVRRGLLVTLVRLSWHYHHLFHELFNYREVHFVAPLFRLIVDHLLCLCGLKLEHGRYFHFGFVSKVVVYSKWWLVSHLSRPISIYRPLSLLRHLSLYYLPSYNSSYVRALSG